jgi:glycosyltransferase involved in cell wall biosynthesis
MRSHTAAVATMLAVHHWLKTWNEKVNVYVVMTEFARQKFIQGDLPADRIVVKPNFIHPLPPVREGTGNYAIYVGRFAPEKRIATVLDTWKMLKGVPLKIVGGGKGEEKIWPLLGNKKPDNIEMLGWLPREEIFALLRKARFLIFPSEWYEGFPMAILEAFASGVPVIASRLGAMVEIIEDCRTGLHFTVGNSNDLAAKVMWAWTHDKEMEVMGREARKVFEEKYTAEKNYWMLMDIYKHACEQKK